MRVRALAYSLVGCAAAVALTFELGHAAVPPAPPLAAPASSAPPSPAPASAGPSASGKPSKSTGGSSGTFAGATAQTDYGPVQVAIVVKGGRITDVKALQLTNQGGRSVAISAQAAPVLRSEALKAQSASIATVSGASYTSDGYRRSLQSAIDKAHL
ncbi:MAG: FMN-binding protein [Amnibacterium sp.]